MGYHDHRGHVAEKDSCKDEFSLDLRQVSPTLSGRGSLIIQPMTPSGPQIDPTARFEQAEDHWQVELSEPLE